MHNHDLLRLKALTNPQRSLEYLRSRWLMRSILGKVASLKPTEHGNILWPENKLGSLSHKNGQIVFATCDNSNAKGIGIDLEKAMVNTKITSIVCNQNEKKILDTIRIQSNMPAEALLAMVFSFKESIYKCIFPYGQKKFYFSDFQVNSIDFTTNKISGVLTTDVSNWDKTNQSLSGYFKHLNIDGDPYILTLTKSFNRAQEQP